MNVFESTNWSIPWQAFPKSESFGSRLNLNAAPGLESRSIDGPWACGGTVLGGTGGTCSCPRCQKISLLAHSIFLLRGCEQGREVEHWMEAAAFLKSYLSKRPLRRRKPGSN